MFEVYESINNFYSKRMKSNFKAGDFCINHGEKYRNFTWFPSVEICGKAQFPHSFGRFARNYAETGAFPQNFHTRKLGEITVFFVVNQQLVIAREILSSFDNNYKVRALYLDLSKAFNTVWHEEINYKLKRNGTSKN